MRFAHQAVQLHGRNPRQIFFRRRTRLCWRPPHQPRHIALSRRHDRLPCRRTRSPRPRHLQLPRPQPQIHRRNRHLDGKLTAFAENLALLSAFAPEKYPMSIGNYSRPPLLHSVLSSTLVFTAALCVRAGGAMILVTGATGNVGLELTKKLFDWGLPVRAFVRDRSRARAIALPGIELVEGDFARPETVARALDGVEQLFLLMPSSAEVEQRQRNLVDTAKRARVKHIVKLSQFGANATAPGRFQRYHAGVELHILMSRIPYTFLRPNLFMQALLNFRSTIASQGIF